MKELIEYIADQLVNDPTQVSVTEANENGRVRIELRLPRMIWAE
jgi:predicted RNA-binding protein YlqC (UPF0109 family)